MRQDAAAFHTGLNIGSLPDDREASTTAARPYSKELLLLQGASVLYHGGYIVVQRCSSSLCSEFWWKKKNGRGSCKIQCSRPRLTIATELPKAIVWGKTHIVIWQEKRFPSSHWLFHICLECRINPQKMLKCWSTWFFEIFLLYIWVLKKTAII